MLSTRVSAYHEYYKMKEFSRASLYVADPEEFLKKTESINEDLIILDYRIVFYKVNPEGTEAEVEIIRTYHILPSVTVNEQRIIQKWKFDPERKEWFLISPY